MVASYGSFNKFYSQVLVGFCFNTKNRFFSEFLWKTVLGIFKIALRLWDQHISVWQSLEILNVFNVLTLKEVFWKNENLFWKTGVPFLSWKYSYWKSNISIIKLAYQNPMLRQIEWAVQKGPITKNADLSNNYLIFLKI